MDYYEKAIEKIKQEVVNPVFYFFSDDVEWCRKNIGDMVGLVSEKHQQGRGAGDEGNFIDHNKGADSYKDLLLMASCKHNIIANSTFSWWGAWLNSNPEKRVIAPEQWFRTNYLEKKEPVYSSRYYNTKDLIPESWVKL